MRRSVALCLALSALPIGADIRLAAQQDDDRWVRSCERHYGDGHGEIYSPAGRRAPKMPT